VRKCRFGGAKSGVDPALLLLALHAFCERHGPLVRVALAARDPLWSRCDRKAAGALFASIRHCICARGCSDIWMEQILNLVLFVARGMQRPKEGPAATGATIGLNQSSPYSELSPVGILVRLLLLGAFRDADPRP
jgi:hypothetical protein